MKELIIFRGVPGSGKSHAAAQLKEKYTAEGKSCGIYSTDDLFTSPTGEYKFDQQKLGYNHRRNLKRVFEATLDSVDVVIVDNTNTTWDEVRKYVVIGLCNGYSIRIEEPSTKWKYDVVECVNRNQHSVPEESIRRMLNRFVADAEIQSKCKLLVESFGKKV